MTPPRAGADHGSAVVAAVFVAACVALLASQVVTASRSTIRAADGELTRARLQAEAEGAVARSVAELQSGVWDLGRAPHVLDADGDVLTIGLEDERGKAPLNTLTQTQAQALFQAAGQANADAGALATAFMDWRDPNRIQANAARAPGAASQEGGFRTIEELRLVPGVTGAIYDALSSSITVSAGDRAYDPAYSTPVAVAAMTGSGVDSPGAIEAKREAEGERPALSAGAGPDLAGRAVTVRVSVEGPHGGRFAGAWLVELTGRAERPYIVRGRSD